MDRIDKVGLYFSVVVVMLMLPFSILIWHYFGGNLRMEMYAFEESSRELRNPERGFYQIYGCMITDEKQNYTRLVEIGRAHV